MSRATQVEQLFQHFKFQVIVDESQSGLVSVLYGENDRCSDGRGHIVVANNMKAKGPAVFGATAGKANLMAAQDGEVANRAYLDAAINHTIKRKFKPGSHNIDEVKIGCAQQAKAEAGELSFAQQNFSAIEAAQYIQSRGGRIAQLDGTHQEYELIWNLVDESTRLPNPSDQKFEVDDWYISFIPAEVVVPAAVELLRSIRKTVNVQTVRIMI